MIKMKMTSLSGSTEKRWKMVSQTGYQVGSVKKRSGGGEQNRRRCK